MKPNLLLLGVDSLLSTHMSLYGYHRLTTPHIDAFAERGVVMENTFSPSIPTTSGYASMFSGKDCFGTDVVALRHKGPLADGCQTLSELLKAEGYTTSSVGFSGNPASRGFDTYLNYSGWGSHAEGRSPKAENLNQVAIPELERLAGAEEPFFLFLRHMDPHSPYLPPGPFERLFYHGDECDPSNKSLEPVYAFKPFADYFRSWFPPGCTDKEYIIAQYDGAIAYMDACIQNIFTTLSSLGLWDNTVVVLTSDHGETLHDHECWYDHHGLYDVTLRVPLVFHFPGVVPQGQRFSESCQLKDILPTLFDVMDLPLQQSCDGRSLTPLFRGESWQPESEMYITECTWMRKHGWRTPEWKLIHALEPDFHFKPEVELYNLIKDPDENHNLAAQEPDVVTFLEQRMQQHIARREQETGRTNPMYTNLNWHGKDCGPFTSSEQAYNTMYIGSPKSAERLQAKEKDD